MLIINTKVDFVSSYHTLRYTVVDLELRIDYNVAMIHQLYFQDCLYNIDRQQTDIKTAIYSKANEQQALNTG